MSVYDLSDYYILAKNGWRKKENSIYKSKKKEDLIDYINMLEHSWAGSLKINELLTKKIQKYDKDGLLKNQNLFAEYLQNYIDVLYEQAQTAEGLDICEEHMLMTLEEIFAKYKQIIEGEEEV